MLAVLICCSTSRDLCFFTSLLSVLDPASWVPDEEGRVAEVRRLRPIAPADMDRFGALNGRLLFEVPENALPSPRPILLTPGENSLSLGPPLAEAVVASMCWGELEDRGEPMPLNWSKSSVLQVSTLRASANIAGRAVSSFSQIIMLGRSE